MITFDLLKQFSIEVAIVIAGALALLWVLRLRSPRVELCFCYAALGVCLLLPFAVRSERIVMPEMKIEAVRHASPITLANLPRPIEWLKLVCAVAGARVLWLFAGLLRLAWYRRHSRPLELTDALREITNQAQTEAAIRITPQLRAPVTFGVIHPTVLLPESFLGMPVAEQLAILCHELLHVRRNDTLAVLGEELVKSALWFHPAVRLLMSRIHFYREQVVDLETIRITNDKEAYLDTLLNVASRQSSMGLELAPMFFRRRHLVERVRSLSEGMPSAGRLAASALFAALPLIAALALWQFPLRGAPQVAEDSAGVHVTSSRVILHRSPVELPTSLNAGEVVLSLTVDANGVVKDVKVISGPEEMRGSVLRSARQWHFEGTGVQETIQASVSYNSAQRLSRGLASPAKVRVDKLDFSMLDDGTGAQARARVPFKEGDWITEEEMARFMTTNQNENNGGGVSGVTASASMTSNGWVIRFMSPPPPPAPPPPAPPAKGVRGGVVSGVIGGIVNGVPGIPAPPEPPPPPSPYQPMTLTRIDASTLPAELRQKVMDQLQAIYEGMSITPHDLDQELAKARAVDEHIQIQRAMRSDSEHNLTIRVTFSLSDPVEPPAAEGMRVRVGGVVQAMNLINMVPPAYPALAKQARVQGTVRFSVIISKDGSVINLQLVNGHPLLVQAATEAVRQWTYRPTLLNGQPVEVITQVDVNFALDQ